MITLLLKKSHLGCVESRNLIICKFLYIPEKIAFRYKGLGLDHNDLEQEGVIGLFQAIDAFDSSEGCSFETYATRRVFTVIDEYVLLNMNVHSIPLYKLKKLRAAKNRLKNCSDERHYDKNINVDDFDIKTVTTESLEYENLESSSNNSENSYAINNKMELSNIVKQVSHHEGGKFLLANTLFGESVSNIAKNYSIKPYLVNKLIQECINECSIN